jgi:hypothetical protein
MAAARRERSSPSAKRQVSQPANAAVKHASAADSKFTRNATPPNCSATMAQRPSKAASG